MAAPKFTCTHCSGTGKQRIPYTRTASDRVCERCAGTGVLALEDAVAEESFQVRPPLPRRLFLTAAAHVAAESAPAGSSGALSEETRPTAPALQNEPTKPPSTTSKARPRAASADRPPLPDRRSMNPLPKPKSSDSRKTHRKRAK